MNDQQDFLQTIQELKELAAVKGGKISPEEIRGAFPDMELTEDHLGFISSYLAGYHIEVEEYEDREAEVWKPEAREDDARDARQFRPHGTADPHRRGRHRERARG